MSGASNYEPLAESDFPHPLPCIACNKELRLGDPSGPNFWPMCDDGVIFHGAGNYGSTVYDPTDSREYLRVVVCDECLKKKSGRIQHVHHEQSRPNAPAPKGTIRFFSETLIQEGVLGTTRHALYRLADQAEGS